MSYSLQYGFGGESRDDIMERATVLRTSDCTVVSTAARVVSPGTRAILCPTNTDAAKAIMPAGISATSTSSVVFQSYVGLSGTPSSAVGLISNDTQGDDRFVRINTSLQIEFYDASGTQYGPTSFGTISTTGMTHVQIAFNRAWDTGGSRFWIQLWMDNVWQFGFIGGDSTSVFGGLNLNDICWGEWLPAATNRGADLYLAHTSVRTASDQTTDPTWLTAYPEIQIVGGASLPPTAAGSHTAWTGTFADVDDFPNDDATSFISTDVEDAKETFTYSAANPVDSGDAVHHVMPRCVNRTVGVKQSGFSLYRDGSGNEVTGAWFAPGTSFVGNITAGIAYNTAPDGTAWVPSDFDLSTGVSTLQFGHQASATDANENVTSSPGPEIYKSAENMAFGRFLYQMPMIGGYL